MVLPTRYRPFVAERSGGRLVVTVDPQDTCLLVYPHPDWEQLEQQLMTLPTLNPQARRLQRLMVGHATEVELDGHGRVALSPELREFAGLTRGAMLIGQGKRLELWDETRWNEQRAAWLESEKSSTESANALDSLSL